MADFETENFGSILNSENIKDDEVDNLVFDDDVFDINDDFEESDNDDKLLSSKLDKSEDTSEFVTNEEEEDDDIPDINDYNLSDHADRSYKERTKESKNFEQLLDNNKKTDGKYENLIFKISGDYDRIKTITSNKTLPETFPSISEIKTVRHAEEIYRLTTKKLSSMMVNDALVEVIPILGDILSFIFNGDRVILGRKPDLTGYSLKLRTKLAYCENNIGSLSDRIVQYPVVSELIKMLSIFGMPLYSTIKENSDRSKQGLKKEKLIELNNKISKS
jgi:hypothetical protein